MQFYIRKPPNIRKPPLLCTFGSKAGGFLICNTPDVTLSHQPCEFQPWSLCWQQPSILCGVYSILERGRVRNSKTIKIFKNWIWKFYYYGPYLSPGCRNEKEKSIFGLSSSRTYFLKLKSLKNIKYSKSYGLLENVLFFASSFVAEELSAS